VKIRLTDTKGVNLRPGMSCRAEIFAATRERALATPIQAIRVEEDLTQKVTKRYVFVARGGVAKRIEIQAGLSDDTYQELTGGIGEGDPVITGPDRVLRALKDGDRIVVAGS